MPKPKLLITGINGLIGKIIRGPLARIYEVYGLDLTPPYSEEIFRTDVTNFQDVSELFQKIAPDKVIHLAGQIQVDTAWTPILQVNIEGTRNIFEAARQARVNQIIFASSNHVTGGYEGFHPNLHLHLQTEPVKISVKDPIRPDSDYGVSKAFGEILARYYCARWGMESICLRIGSVRADDDPTENLRFKRTWLSHRDLIQLVEKSLDSNISFGIYYGISNNKGAFWDISNAQIELGYNPQDDASRIYKAKGK